MKIAAWDLGANMALCHNLFEVPYAMHWTFTGNREQRAADTLDMLTETFETLASHGLDAVIYERPFARGQAATRALWGVAGLVEAVATKAGLPVVDIDPSTIKKWAAARGGATKTDMILAAQIMGYAGSNEHEADAYCLLRYAETNIQRIDDASPSKAKRRGSNRKTAGTA